MLHVMTGKSRVRFASALKSAETKKMYFWFTRSDSLGGCKILEELNSPLMIFFPSELHKIHILELIKKRENVPNLKKKKN